MNLFDPGGIKATGLGRRDRVSCVSADVFSQVSDSNGVLVQSKFDAFLREALKLPTAVYEGPSFGYAHATTRPCFPQQV